MIIAIDGPAASGKGTLARRIAAHYGYHFLDTGLLYRAVARDVRRAGRPLEDTAAAIAAAERIDPDSLDDPLLRSAEAGEGASVVARIPDVRASLLAYQRAFSRRPPGAVLDGRDIASVVCPQADVKIYVTASLEERARRRKLELEAKGTRLGYEEVLEQLKVRDKRDSERAAAPMLRAPDAHLLDTTELDIETAFRTAVALIDRLAGQQRCPPVRGAP
jgi:cytidylate kinase